VAKQHRPDVVVLDVRMPGVDGFDACIELKAEAPHINVIVFTADDSAHLQAKAVEVGATALF
jgi:CheY-like chemotaxis protein